MRQRKMRVSSEGVGEDNEISFKLIKCDDGRAALNRYVSWQVDVV